LTPGMIPERCHNETRHADCEACTHARELVSNAIVTSVREVMASMESHNLARARSHIAGLVELLGQIPLSTAELVGPRKLTALSGDLNRALSEIGDEALALATLRGVLLGWVEVPHSRVH
jgi:hypothetical protein